MTVIKLKFQLIKNWNKKAKINFSTFIFIEFRFYISIHEISNFLFILRVFLHFQLCHFQWFTYASFVYNIIYTHLCVLVKCFFHKTSHICYLRPRENKVICSSVDWNLKQGRQFVSNKSFELYYVMMLYYDVVSGKVMLLKGFFPGKVPSTPWRNMKIFWNITK